MILYLIATPQDFPTLRGRALLYSLRNTVYASPLTSDGQLDVGAAITVRDEDVDELMRKSQYRTRDGEARSVWTKSPSEAALRKEAWLRGEPYAAAAVEDSEVDLRRRASAGLSTDDLVQILAERGVTVSTEDSEDEPAAPVKSTRGRKPLPPQTFTPPPITVATTGDSDED